jgi:beta-galactosidase
MQEFKTIAAPLLITTSSPATGSFKVKNRNFFIDTKDYEILWNITREGTVLDFGRAKLPLTKPQGTSVIKVLSKHLKTSADPGERFITFSVVQKSATAWALASAEIGWAQFKLPSKAKPKTKILPPTTLENSIASDGSIFLGFGSFEPKLNLYRAPTDNDRIGNISGRWHEWGLDQLERTKIKVSSLGESYKINSIYRTRTGIEIKHQQLVSQVENGVQIVEEILLPSTLSDVARVGTTFELGIEFSRMRYFGAGPFETYPDRRLNPIGQYESRVVKQYVPYVRPQENSGHADVRWLEVINDHGHIIRIELDKPGQASVTPYRASELATATHDVELKDSVVTVVAFDAVHRGLGTASCGPDTLPQYLIRPGKHVLSYTITYK